MTNSISLSEIREQILNPNFYQPKHLWFDDVEVIVSPLLPQIITRDVRPLAAKQWHGNRGTGRYALRIAKKWRKRFGQRKEVVDCYIVNANAWAVFGKGYGQVLVVSAAKFAQIKEALNDQKNKARA